ncbi:MAG: helix-turn-helix domain-containing protein [Pirellulaceae bacterium]
MIPAEEMSESALSTSPKSGEITPASQQRRVDKPFSAIASTSFAGTTYALPGTEYFTKCQQKRPRKSRGQPPRLDDRLKSLVAKLVSRGMSYRAAGQHAGIDHSTISRAAQRDPAFAAALKEARRLGRLRPRLGIRGWRQAAAALQRQGFDPQWTKEEKQLMEGSFPGSICWRTLPFPHDERPQD